MQPAHRLAAPAVLLLLALASVSGCGQVDSSSFPPEVVPERVRVLRLQIPDFDESQIEGIRLWHRSESSGEFEFVSGIRLSEPVVEASGEFIGYVLLDPGGNEIDLPLSSGVERQDDAANLTLWVVRFGPEGEYKASVHNAAGESMLSQASVML